MLAHTVPTLLYMSTCCNELINILFHLNDNTIQMQIKTDIYIQYKLVQGTYLTLTVLVGQESECLKFIKMLLLWYLRDWLICPMCHTFPFPSTFFYSPPFIPFSLHLVFITIPTPCISVSLPFLYHTFTNPNLLSNRYSQKGLFQSYFPLSLAAILPAVSSSLPLTS